jgi:hypothetical protein
MFGRLISSSFLPHQPGRPLPHRVRAALQCRDHQRRHRRGPVHRYREDAVYLAGRDAHAAHDAPYATSSRARPSSANTMATASDRSGERPGRGRGARAAAGAANRSSPPVLLTTTVPPRISGPTTHRQRHTRPKPGSQSYGSSLSSATPGSQTPRRAPRPPSCRTGWLGSRSFSIPDSRSAVPPLAWRPHASPSSALRQRGGRAR